MGIIHWDLVLQKSKHQKDPLKAIISTAFKPAHKKVCFLDDIGSLVGWGKLKTI
jgi:hypothetical protein